MDVPLAEAEAIVDLQQGSLFISVYEPATPGSPARKILHEIQIDPVTQSLTDVAAAISAVDHLEAVVIDQTGSISILAEPDYFFDFTGGMDDRLETTGITGTTRPTVGGRYLEDQNDEFTFQFVGSGTIGVTEGLKIEVRDAAGALLASLDIGQGYAPDTELTIARGVKFGLSSGTANDGDSFSMTVVGQPDTVGLLPALGLNTLFTGRNAETLSVDQPLLDDPARFASTRSGLPGDTSNAESMFRLRDQLVMVDGTRKLETFVADIISGIGTEVRDLAHIQQNMQLIGDSLRAQRESVSGVDPNEEMIKMLQFQRSFQAAARYVTSIDETLQELFNIIR